LILEDSKASANIFKAIIDADSVLNFQAYVVQR